MTVAVAHSDSPRGKAALRCGAEEAVLRGEPLVVMRIVGGVDEPPPEKPKVVKRIAEELADFPDLEWSVVTGAEGFDTAEAIVELADKVGASIIVIGSRRRRPVVKLLLGSVVQRVLLESHLPVLVIRS